MMPEHYLLQPSKYHMIRVIVFRVLSPKATLDLVRGYCKVKKVFGFCHQSQSQSSSAALNAPDLLRGFDTAFFPPLPRLRDVPRDEDALRPDPRLGPVENPGSGQSAFTIHP